VLQTFGGLLLQKLDDGLPVWANNHQRAMGVPYYTGHLILDDGVQNLANLFRVQTFHKLSLD
jgi:hypothetical protein